MESESEMDFEVRRVSDFESLRPAYEIWTARSVYSLDTSMVVISVFDRLLRCDETDHALLGAELVGGQRGVGPKRELSFPLPAIGSTALFRRGGHVEIITSSMVERVVMLSQRLQLAGA